MPVNDLIQLRRGTAATWTSANPTLSAGECGIETDTGLLKVGDGSTAWTSLPYDAAKLPASFTAGSVLFVGATDVITQDNANFFWDDTNNRLGIGTATPSQALTVTDGSILLDNTSGSGIMGRRVSGSVAGTILKVDTNTTLLTSIGGQPIHIYPNNGTIPALTIADTGAVTLGYGLSIGTSFTVGSVGTSGALYLKRDTGATIVSVLQEGTSGLRVRVAGGSSYITFQTNAVTDALRIIDNGRVGIGDTTPDGQLDVQVSSASTIGLTVQCAAAQTGNLINLQDVAGAVLTSFTAAGYLGIGITPTAYLHLKAGTTAAGTAPIKLTAGPVNTTPESGALEFDGDSYYVSLPSVRRSIVTGNDIRVADVIVTNTTTETTIHTSAVAANSLKAGKLYKITLLGKTTTANASQFFTLRFKMGGTTLITIVMAAAAMTDDHFRSESYITIRTVGGSGTYAAHVEATIGNQEVSATPVTGSVDTTVAEDMTVTLQWDAANAGNVYTGMQAMLEVVG